MIVVYIFDTETNVKLQKILVLVTRKKVNVTEYCALYLIFGASVYSGISCESRMKHDDVDLMGEAFISLHHFYPKDCCFAKTLVCWIKTLSAEILTYFPRVQCLE